MWNYHLCMQLMRLKVVDDTYIHSSLCYIRFLCIGSFPQLKNWKIYNICVYV